LSAATRFCHRTSFCLWILVGAAIANAQPPLTLPPAQQRIFDEVSQLRDGGRLEVHGDAIASTVVLPDFYSRRNFSPAWNDSTAAALLRAIDDAAADGLDPDDYHRQALLGPGDGSEIASADRDLLLTDALIRLAYHHLFGKVDPEALDPHWNLSREINDVDPAAALQTAIDSGDLGGAIERLKPQGLLYRRLKGALATYRAIADHGGWPQVPAGEALKPGVTAEDARLTALRQRLAAEGDLASADAIGAASVYDDSLVAAVQRFQVRHGLAADGVIGANTVAAMNVPVTQRIDQIRVNLERSRWVFRKADERFVVTNIAAYQVFYFDSGQLVWRSRCQVGKEARQTPIFGAEIKHVELNPTWTVPPTIFAKDILPAVKRDSGYLAKRGLKVIDARGKTIPSSAIDWSTVTPRNFGYMLRQDPGPKCALGRVKFVSPNEHSVYLHDTPSQELFQADQRAFSSGCIRVEHPLELARLLIDDPAWTDAEIAATVNTEKTTPIVLAKPVPVYFLYFTATADPEGKAHFFRDLYRRDPGVLAALGREFSFRSRPVIGTSKITAGS
jgi:L,D-transpeptidase YcbB